MLIDAASGLVGMVGGAYAPGTAVAAQAAAKALKAADATGEEIKRVDAIGQLAAAYREQIKRISSNLERDVRPINDEIDARLNIWESCEYQKLRHIQQVDSSTLIEKEVRYRQFYDVKAKLRAQISGATNAEQLFKELPKLHDGLITALTNRAYNLQELQKIAGQIKDDVDAFDAAVTAAKGVKLSVI